MIGTIADTCTIRHESAQGKSGRKILYGVPPWLALWPFVTYTASMMDEQTAERIARLATLPIADLRLHVSDGDGTQADADRELMGWTRYELLVYLLTD